MFAPSSVSRLIYAEVSTIWSSRRPPNFTDSSSARFPFLSAKTSRQTKKPISKQIYSGSGDNLWYTHWLTYQLTGLPNTLSELLVGEENLLDEGVFERVFTSVKSVLQDTEGMSIDDVVEHLQGSLGMESTKEAFKTQRTLVFAILGWQSMLYQPAFNVCSLDQFAIDEDSCQPNSGLVYDNFKVDAELAERPLFVLLKGFGNLLPSPSPQITQVASERGRFIAEWMPLISAEMNVYLLHTLLRVQIKWVDTLSLHLDFDKSSRTLSLFSCPSFCVQMLQSRGTIHAFASTDQSAFDPRADEQEISNILTEILLSYRLLFGQSSRSRKLFPHVFIPPESLRNEVDPLLLQLCMMEDLHDMPPKMPGDQPVYFANQHFPVFSERIELIAKELKRAKPDSVGGLLHDRRDKMQYWTFWLVSIFGSVSILLSLVQVILQGIQLSQS